MKLNKTKKILALLPISILAFALSSCDPSDGFIEEKVPADTAPIEVSMTGGINPDELNLSDQATITFNRFPWTVAKFQEMQSKVGTEPQGAVVMVLVAMEIFRHYPVIGEKCLYLATSKNEHDPNNAGRVSPERIMKRLNELLRRTGDSYARPYQVAAYLKGATQQNGYIPNKPFTVQVQAMNVAYEYNAELDAKFIQYYVLCGGKDSGKDIIRVIKPWDSKYYVVDNFPGLYSQVKVLPGSKTWDDKMFINH